jgi:hypothetical protein
LCGTAAAAAGSVKTRPMPLDGYTETKWIRAINGIYLAGVALQVLCQLSISQD